MSELWAELCPRCERHFTDLATHAQGVCAPVVLLEIEPVQPPDFAFARWVEIFWSRVDRRGPDECWPWLNALDQHGYGVVGIPGRFPAFREQVGLTKGGTARAHRVSWVLANGPIAPGVVIRHRCDRSYGCCNPAHLVIGNHEENANDEAVKNRMRRAGSQP